MSADPTPKICTLTPDQLQETAEDLCSEAMVIQRLLYILMVDLENNFVESRARHVDGDILTFSFQRRAIDVLEWVCGQAWSKSADLVERLDRLYLNERPTERGGAK